MKRKPKVGDDVTVRAWYCEWDRREGKVVAISKRPGDTLPYMVEDRMFNQWPFAAEELELHQS